MLGEFFNNREIATGFWYIVFPVLVSCVFYRRVKDIWLSLLRLVGSVFQRPILYLVATYFLVLGTVCFVLSKLGLWDSSVLKETLIWAFFSGIGLAMSKIGDAENSELGYRAAITGQIKVTAILIFLVGLSPFSLLVEILFIVPIVSFFTLLCAVTSISAIGSRSKSVLENICNFFLALVFLGMLVQTGLAIIANPSTLLSFHVLQTFLLPIIFTLAILPFAYLVNFYAAIESISVRMTFGDRMPFDLRFYFLLKLVGVVGISNAKLRRVSKLVGDRMTWAKDHDQIDDLFLKLKDALKDPEAVQSGDFNWHPLSEATRTSNEEFELDYFASDESYQVAMQDIVRESLELAENCKTLIGEYENGTLQLDDYLEHLQSYEPLILDLSHRRNELPMARRGLRAVNDACCSLRSNLSCLILRSNSYEFETGSITQFNWIMKTFTDGIYEDSYQLEKLWQEKFGEGPY